MKKLISLLLTAALMLGLSACSSATGAQTASRLAQESAAPESTPEITPISQEPTETETPTEAPEESGSKILVLYFSRTGEQYNVGVIEKGNTAIVAEMIGEATGADLHEILPADDHYPMTYNALIDVALQEQRDDPVHSV